MLILQNITKNRLKYIFILASLLLLTLAFSSCEKDDPEVPNEEELITTLNYILTPMGGGSTVTLSFLDLDGDGGNAPTITGGTLDTNQTYTGSIEVRNDAEIPAEDITIEILNEAEEHQFFFQTTVNGLSISYSDQDANGNPIGLTSSLSTQSANTGTLTLILRHEPNKTAAGVSSGDITNAGGETDIEITFPVNVQ